MLTKRQRDYQRYRRRGTTTERGYGREHQKVRASWSPLVDAGMVQCHAVICVMPTRWIEPGSKWHLGHTADRSGWTGPEHQRCNTADGGRRRGRGRRLPEAYGRW